MMKYVTKWLAALAICLCAGCGDTTFHYVTTLNGTNGTGQEYLSWNNVTDSTGYNVYRGTASGGLADKAKIAANVQGTFYTDAAVTSGTHYFYQVTSLSPGGESQPSYEIEVVP